MHNTWERIEVKGGRYRWKEPAPVSCADSSVEKIDWSAYRDVIGTPVGVILPDGTSPTGTPIRVIVFPMGTGPGCWYGCSGMDENELARLCCPQCGVLMFLPINAFAIARGGLVMPKLKCIRCPWFEVVRLEGWVA